MTDKESSSKSSGRNPVHFEPLEEGLRADDSWQQDLVNRLAFAALNEQRRSRRWNVFFKGLLALYLLALLFLYMPTEWSSLGKLAEKHTPARILSLAVCAMHSRTRTPRV
jgi:hypothetical protein